MQNGNPDAAKIAKEFFNDLTRVWNTESRLMLESVLRELQRDDSGPSAEMAGIRTEQTAVTNTLFAPASRAAEDANSGTFFAKTRRVAADEAYKDN